MKFFLDRDYLFNFVKQNKSAIIKVSVGFVILILAFFVFTARQDGKADFELNRGSESEVASITEKENSDGDKAKKAQNEEEDADKKIFVDVSGAVVNPDVYELKAGARVYEAIKMAGGFLENANSQNLNLAAKLSDQDKIVVLTDEEADTKCGSPEQSGEVNGFSSQAQIGGKVNINNATVEELQTIKGIGPAMAARILEYRRSNGGFASVDDLRNVKGIGEKTFAKLRESIKV